MVYHDSPEPAEHPEFTVLSNYSRHFVNIGAFEESQPLTARGRGFMDGLVTDIQRWGDAGLLSKVALKAINDNQTGSGRSGNRNTSKVPDPQEPDTIMVNEWPQGTHVLTGRRQTIRPGAAPFHCGHKALGCRSL